MSHWSTKTSPIDRNYIVIKHALPGVNQVIQGVKFRGGFAVVELDSKTYFNIKKFPMLKNAKEFPLTFLAKLPFITRTIDIKTIYGADVYSKYLNKVSEEKAAEKALKEEKKEADHLADLTKCQYRYTEGSSKGKLCGGESEDSPSHYCLRHVVFDPKIDIKTTMPITREGKEKLATKILKDIDSYIINE